LKKKCNFHPFTLCEALLDGYRIANPEETQLADEFARLKKRADYLKSRHVCIEQNKGKGVLVRDFVDTHIKEVEQWLANCDRFSNSFCGTPVADKPE
jgi:hypothetical protein